eukprot:2893916-Lingulodinium_polyedra.AAC.1
MPSPRPAAHENCRLGLPPGPYPEGQLPRGRILFQRHMAGTGQGGEGEGRGETPPAVAPRHWRPLPGGRGRDLSRRVCLTK